MDVDGSLAGSALCISSDIFEKFNMFPQKVSGGFDQQTIRGIKKPAYRVVEALRQTGDTRILLSGFRA